MDKRQCCGEFSTRTQSALEPTQYHSSWREWNWSLVGALIINFGLWAFLLLLLLSPAGANSADGPKEGQVEMTYALTWGLVAHDLGLAPAKRLSDFVPPTVEVLNQDDLCAQSYKPRGCTPAAVSAGQRVLISDRLDWSDPADMTILLHEFVHFFQEQARGPLMVNECNEIATREMYAYKVQGLALEKLPDWNRGKVDQWLELAKRGTHQQWVICYRTYIW